MAFTSSSSSAPSSNGSGSGISAGLTAALRGLLPHSPADMEKGLSLLEVSFPTGKGRVLEGELLFPSEAHMQPVLPFTKSCDSWMCVACVDPDAPSAGNAYAAPYLHWLLCDIPPLGDTADGTVLMRWAGPTPPRASGVHRYLTLLFKQQKGKGVGTQMGAGAASAAIHERAKFPLQDFVQKHSLQLIGAHMFHSASDPEHFSQQHGLVGDAASGKRLKEHLHNPHHTAAGTVGSAHTAGGGTTAGGTAGQGSSGSSGRM